MAPSRAGATPLTAPTGTSSPSVSLTLFQHPTSAASACTPVLVALRSCPSQAFVVLVLPRADSRRTRTRTKKEVIIFRGALFIVATFVQEPKTSTPSQFPRLCRLRLPPAVNDLKSRDLAVTRLAFLDTADTVSDKLVTTSSIILLLPLAPSMRTMSPPALLF
jgi:hypothetical protein